MKTTRHPAPAGSRRGSSLIEAIIAVGVLAVAVPLVLGTLAESGTTTISSRAETRTSWVVPACLAELQAARTGNSRFIPQIPAGREFENLALAFSGEGNLIAPIDPGAYSSGVRNNDAVRYIVSMSAELVQDTANPDTSMRQLRIRLEYPAAAPVNKRDKIDFYTRLP